MELIEAIKEGDIEVVKKAIADGEDVNAKDDDGGTPLDAAVYEGRAVVVHLLIAAGADVNAKNDNGQTPLHAADNKEIAELLIAAGADVNDGLLFSHVDRPHSETIIELLIKNGADVNAKEEDVTPLHIAVNVGRREIAELLIAAGADVNVKDGDGETPLDLTATFPGEPAYDETAELLLEHGGKTGEELAELRNIIIGAVEEGNIEAVKQHLDAGTDVNAKDYDDFGLTTLLHRASMMGHKEVAGLLITKGADVNAKDAVWDESVVGETPLDCAIEKNHTEIADLLRKHGGKTGGELKAEGK